MNENYSTQRQVQKGFKTFIFTLSISLIVFSVIYYLISDKQSGVVDTSVQVNTQQVQNEIAEQVTGQEVLGVTDEKSVPIEGVVVDEEETVFGKLSATPVDTNTRAVLADTAPTSRTGVGATAAKVKTTTATAPSTGVTEITWGFFVSTVAFLLALFVISKDPRKMALQHFENKMLKK